MTHRTFFRQLPAQRTLRRITGALTLCGLLGSSACGQEERAINDPKWLPQAQGRAVGEEFTVRYDDADAQFVLHALGYAKKGEGRYERRTDLTAQEALVPSAMPSLPEIDAIAVITVYRAFLGEQQYVYDTLRSLLLELPPEAQINVLVGNDDTAYVSEERLIHEIGARNVGRVHVLPASQPIAQFFKDEAIDTKTRATWNYARALRSYRGTNHVMVFEDDVSLARGSLAQLRPYLRLPGLPVFALFNDRCDSVATTRQLPDTLVSLGTQTMLHSYDFPTIQATVFHSRVANAAGRYIATRAGRESHDYMLGRYFAQTQSDLAYIKPSIVQHQGLKTTGLSGPNSLPLSTCYVDSFLPDAAAPAAAQQP